MVAGLTVDQMPVRARVVQLHQLPSSSGETLKCSVVMPTVISTVFLTALVGTLNERAANPEEVSSLARIPTKSKHWSMLGAIKGKGS